MQASYLCTDREDQRNSTDGVTWECSTRRVKYVCIRDSTHLQDAVFWEVGTVNCVFHFVFAIKSSQCVGAKTPWNLLWNENMKIVSPSSIKQAQHSYRDRLFVPGSCVGDTVQLSIWTSCSVVRHWEVNITQQLDMWSGRGSNRTLRHRTCFLFTFQYVRTANCGRICFCKTANFESFFL